MAVRSARNVEKQKKKNRRAAPREKVTRLQGNKGGRPPPPEEDGGQGPSGQKGIGGAAIVDPFAGTTPVAASRARWALQGCKSRPGFCSKGPLCSSIHEVEPPQLLACRS